MLRLPKFEYRRPETLDEALSILRDYGPDAMPVAGGTDVFPKMKRRQFRPKVLVSLRRIPELREISGDARSGLTIQAGATLTEVSTHPQIREHYPGLARATGVISTPILRNMGTIGGNLCLDTRCQYYDQTRPWREALPSFGTRIRGQDRSWARRGFRSSCASGWSPVRRGSGDGEGTFNPYRAARTCTSTTWAGCSTSWPRSAGWPFP